LKDIVEGKRTLMIPCMHAIAPSATVIYSRLFALGIVSTFS